MCTCNETKGKTDMNQAELTKLAIAGGILFAAYKYGNGMVKAGALAVAAGMIAKRVPYVKDVL
jgi:hypothetical protein